MPTLAQVRNFVDSRLTTLWQDQIVPRQNAYFAARGRYWQGIRTLNLASLPNNPNDANATVLEAAPVMSGRPTDQSETWTDSGIVLGASIPMAIQIDTYHGILGKGYVGTVWARWNGNTYKRSQQHGPEPWRTEAWAQVTAGV